MDTKEPVQDLNVVGSTGTDSDFKVRSYESLDFKAILFRQIVIIQNKMLDGDRAGFINSVELLEALLSHYVDDEYKKERGKIVAEYRKEMLKLNPMSEEYERNHDEQLMFRMAFKKFNALMSLLGRRNLLPLPAFSGRIVPNYYHKVDKVYEEEYSITDKKIEELEEKLRKVKEEIEEEALSELEDVDENLEDKEIEIVEDDVLKTLRGELDEVKEEEG